MRTVFKLHVMLVLVLTGLLGSCKNNQDGYSDEIQTSETPIDSTKTAADTTQTANDSGVGEEGANTGGMSSGSNNSSATTAGKGSGPGESAEDGSTYSKSSGVQKDSIKSKAKTAKSKNEK